MEFFQRCMQLTKTHALKMVHCCDAKKKKGKQKQKQKTNESVS